MSEENCSRHRNIDVSVCYVILCNVMLCYVMLWCHGFIMLYLFGFQIETISHMISPYMRVNMLYICLTQSWGYKIYMETDCRHFMQFLNVSFCGIIVEKGIYIKAFLKNCEMMKLLAQ